MGKIPHSHSASGDGSPKALLWGFLPPHLSICLLVTPNSSNSLGRRHNRKDKGKSIGKVKVKGLRTDFRLAERTTLLSGRLHILLKCERSTFKPKMYPESAKYYCF